MTTPAWTFTFYDGTTTVTFEVVERTFGFDPGPANAPVVTSSFRAHLLATGADDIFDLLDTVRTVELMFTQARRYQTIYLGSRVFVQWKESASGDTWRSEILDGRIEYDKDTIGYFWQANELNFTIAITRRNYWEGSETELPLANGNESVGGTPQLNGINVFNCDDASGSAPNKRVNYVEIAAAAVIGDLPAPPRLEFTNTYNNVTGDRNLHVCHSLLPDPANLVHLLEAEAATGGSGSADATCSGGNYQSNTLGGDSEQVLFTWTPNAAAWNAMGGNWFKVFARMRTLPTGTTKVRLQVFAGATMFWQQPTQTTLDTTTYLQELGTVQLPPAYLAGSRYPMSIVLTGQKTGGLTLALDFLMVFPLDAMREFIPKGAGLEYNARLVDDSILVPPRVYTDSHSSAGMLPDYYPDAYQSELIMLYPGALQRLIFLWDATDKTAAIARTATVRLYYRPRRLGL